MEPFYFLLLIMSRHDTPIRGPVSSASPQLLEAKNSESCKAHEPVDHLSCYVSYWNSPFGATDWTIGGGLVASPGVPCASPLQCCGRSGFSQDFLSRQTEMTTYNQEQTDDTSRSVARRKDLRR